MPRILDASGGVVSYVEYDPLTDETTIGTYQDCEPILEQNKKLQTMNDGYSPSREMRRVASIPLTLVEQWRREAGLGMEFWTWPRREKIAFIKTKLADPDWRYLRTSPGGL